MENLTAQAARLRFGRDLRLLEVRALLRSSAPAVLRMGGAPQVGSQYYINLQGFNVHGANRTHGTDYTAVCSQCVKE